MKRFVLLLTAVILTVSGCRYSSEPDEKSFVTAIGIDKGEKYELRFTFIFASPQKDDSKGKESEENETVVIEAPSIYSAIEQMSSFKSKAVELTHVQTVIFSEELAKEGLKDYIYALVRSDDFRPNIYVCVADKSSMEFLEKIKPGQTPHLEKYFQLIFKKMNLGSYGEMYLYDLYFDLLSAGKASILPYCAVNSLQIEEAAEEPSEGKEEPSENGSEGAGGSNEEPSENGGRFASYTDDFAINSTAGGTVQKNENPAEIQGAAVIKDGMYAALLGRNENMIVQMLNSKFPDSYISAADPYNENNTVTVYISQKDKTRVTVNTGDVPEISIRADLEGDFVSLGENDAFIKNPSLFEAYFEEKIKEEVLKLLEKSARELDCDVCSFFRQAKRCFANVRDWEEYDWAGKYKNAEFNVEINVTMRSYGELSRNV